MVNLTRIYTRTGDDGTTSLGDMSRTGKNDARLVAYADCDELNAALGVVLAVGAPAGDVAAVVRRVQNELFDVGADLSAPVAPGESRLRITPQYTGRLEADCDRFNAGQRPLRSFILPGGSPAAALLHVARTIARRAERSTWRALQEHGATMNAETATYLNRLSDLLFILARTANAGADVTWQPGGHDAQ